MLYNAELRPLKQLNKSWLVKLSWLENAHSDSRQHLGDVDN